MCAHTHQKTEGEIEIKATCSTPQANQNGYNATNKTQLTRRGTPRASAPTNKSPILPFAFCIMHLSTVGAHRVRPYPQI